MSKQQGTETSSRECGHPKKRNHKNGWQLNTSKFRGIFQELITKVCCKRDFVNLMWWNEQKYLGIFVGFEYELPDWYSYETQL